MKISVVSKSLSQITAQALLVFLFADKTGAEEKLINEALHGQVQKLRQSKDFTGKTREVRLLFGTPLFSRVALTGLGQIKTVSLETLREGVGAAMAEIKKLPIKNLAVVLPRLPKYSPAEVAQALVETLLIANYEFGHYKKPDGSHAEIAETKLLVLEKREAKQAARGGAAGEILGLNVNFTRDLGNHPANTVTPRHLAKHASELGQQHPNKIKVKVLGRTEMKRENMNALLAVAQGSEEEPQFLILEYRAKKSAPMVVLVGKGITFDSGGISLKPSEKMEEMKFDMAGAATVLGIIKTAAELNLPLNLIGLVPAAENLPSGKAIKPGDIVRSRSGKTVEIVNTDAEGRLALCDALDFAKTYQPDLLIDFATLTGAIVVALGDDLIGAFSNRENLLAKLQQAARVTGEKMWPMPLENSYEEFIKSDAADLRNIGTTRYGDSINAALFLQNFTAYPWIHLDIAGVAWATRSKPYYGKGATGAGIRLAIEFLKSLSKKLK